MRERYAGSDVDGNGEESGDSDMGSQFAAGHRLQRGLPDLDLAVAAWLSAKERMSASRKTREAYAAAMTGFRTLLQSQGFDLDAADPRRVRVDYHSGDSRDIMTDATAYAASEGVYESSGPALHLQSAHAPSPTRQPSSSQVRELEEIEQLQAEHARLLSIAAEAFATRPAETRYGPRPVKAATVNLRLAALSSFYTFALHRDFLRGPNPITRVARQRVRGYEAATPMHYEDLRERLARIDRDTLAGQRDYALLLLGLHTGRRLSELAGMCREHLVIRSGSVEITWPRCKGNKQMRDILPRGGAQGIAADALITWVETRAEIMARLLQSQQQPNERETDAAAGHRAGRASGDRAEISETVGARRREMREVMPLREQAIASGQSPFTRRVSQQPIWISLANNGTLGHALNLSSIADICERRLGTSKVHTLRHTFARALEDAGVKVSEIQAQLGHESLQTTGRYLARLHQGEHRHLASISALYGLAASETAKAPTSANAHSDAPSAPSASEQ